MKMSSSRVYFKHGRYSDTCQQAQYDHEQNFIDPPALVYLVHFTPRDSQFYYKIGYTTNTVRQRFGIYPDPNLPPYHKIAEIFTTKKNAIDLEKTLHDAFKPKQYFPPSRHPGYTECFILNDDDVNWIRKIFFLTS